MLRDLAIHQESSEGYIYERRYLQRGIPEAIEKAHDEGMGLPLHLNSVSRLPHSRWLRNLAFGIQEKYGY